MLLFVWETGGRGDKPPIRCAVGSRFSVVQLLSQWWSGISCTTAQYSEVVPVSGRKAPLSVGKELKRQATYRF